MGLADKVHKKTNTDNSTHESDKLYHDVEFTLDEVDILIRVIASANFPVKEIEPLYKAIFKLQNLRNIISKNAT